LRENNERKRRWGVFLGSQHFEGREVCWSFRMGSKKINEQFNYSHELAQTKQQVGYYVVRTLSYMEKPRVNINSQHSSWLKVGESHHLPSYNILCAWLHDQHPNVILSQDSKCESQNF